MKADASSGRLDKLIQRAKADIKANRVKPLDEVIDNKKIFGKRMPFYHQK